MKRTPLKRKTPLRRKSPLRQKDPVTASKNPGRKKTLKPGKKTGAGRGKGRPYHSIFTDDMGKCHMTGDCRGVEPHHIFQGKSGRFYSEKYGFMLPLRSDWHRTGSYSIHRNRRLNVSYKICCQGYYVNVLGKTKEEWISEFGKWWGDEDMGKGEAGKEGTGEEETEQMEGIKDGDGSSADGIYVGMEVHGLFLGARGYFVTEGVVTGRESGKFDVWYGKILHWMTYGDEDMGRIVHRDRETAVRQAAGMQDWKDRAGREDFAEQNSKPFGKI